MAVRASLRFTLVIVGVLMIVAPGCGRSATTSLIGPTSSKCEVSVTNNLPSVPATGGSGNLTVATNRDCAWSAKADAPWITLSSSDGQGPAAVNYTVAVNANATPRQGAVVVAEQRVVVTQEAAPCRYTVSPTTRDVAATGEAISITLTTLDGCAWTARGDADWIGAAKPASGQSSGSVRFDVSPNTGLARSSTATIAGQLVRINQAASPQPLPGSPTPSPTPVPPPPAPVPGPPAPPPAPGCTYAVAPTAKTVAASGEVLTIIVTTANDCSWSATSSTGWITITGGNAASGNGSVRVTVAANTGPARSANIRVAGQSVTLEQPEAPAPPPPPPPPPCSYNIAPASASVPRADGVITISVTAGDTCAWTAASQAGWITVSDGGAGSGNGTVRLVVASNSGPSRSGTVIVAGKTFTVQQDGACSYSIRPGSYSAGRGPDNVLVNVTAGDGCTWTADTNVTWISIPEGRTGSGNGTVHLVVEANDSGARTATLTIAGQPFTLSQAQGACPATLKPGDYHSGRGPDSISIIVTVDPGCTWTATSPVSWVTVAEGNAGTGSGTVRLAVQPNSDTTRSTTLTIAGQPFNVLQDGEK